MVHLPFIFVTKNNMKQYVIKLKRKDIRFMHQHQRSVLLTRAMDLLVIGWRRGRITTLFQPREMMMMMMIII